jgi:hypothetical protein
MVHGHGVIVLLFTFPKKNGYYRLWQKLINPMKTTTTRWPITLESPVEDVDVDGVDINDNEYSRRPTVPTIAREKTQYFQSPPRGESRRQDRTTTTLMEEKTLQHNRDEALRQKALEYVSVPANYGANTTASIKRAEPAVPDLTSPWVRQFMASCPKDVLLPVPRDYIWTIQSGSASTVVEDFLTK